MLTGLNEARPVINTCISIMVEIGKRNGKSSFGFIGANSDGESISQTKRFKVYRRFMATYFSEESFVHVQNESRSAYVMIRRVELEKNFNLLKVLNEKFKEMYNFLD